MKTGKPANGSGKTRFNRAKASGESWIALRYKAMQKRSFLPDTNLGIAVPEPLKEAKAKKEPLPA